MCAKPIKAQEHDRILIWCHCFTRMLSTLSPSPPTYPSCTPSLLSLSLSLSHTLDVLSFHHVFSHMTQSQQCKRHVLVMSMSASLNLSRLNQYLPHLHLDLSSKLYKHHNTAMSIYSSCEYRCCSAVTFLMAARINPWWPLLKWQGPQYHTSVMHTVWAWN